MFRPLDGTIHRQPFCSLSHPVSYPVFTRRSILAKTLAEALADFASDLSDDSAAHYDRLSAFVQDIAQIGRLLPIGSLAPDFTLPSDRDAPISLSELLRAGPLLLVFARGAWCRFCRAELSAFADAWPAFKEAGVSVVAITPELHGGAAALRRQLDLPFPVLCDIDGGVALSYGCLFALPPRERERLRNERFDIATAYGADGRFMPLPACFGIAPDRRIVSNCAEPDMRRFPPIERVLNDVTTGLAR